MKREFRCDRGSLQKPKRTPHGFLRCDGIAARTGVLEYLNPDGTTRRELRLPEDVFAPSALEGFEGAPLTDGHPQVPVTAENVKQYEVGNVTGPARRDGEHVAVSIVVKDPKVIAGLERGDTGLSVGYAVDLEETPGTHPQYGRYDAIQRNIVINHLAARVSPRAGNAARIRMDAVDVREELAGDQLDQRSGPRAEISQQQIDHRNRTTEGSSMKTAEQRADEAEAAVATLKTEVARLEALIASGAQAAETDAVRAAMQRADAAETERKKIADAFGDAVKQRVTLISQAQLHLDSTVKFDTMTDRQVQEAVVKRLDSSAAATLATENDDQVRGRYNTLIGLSAKNVESQKKIAEVLAKSNGGDRKDQEGEQSYDDMCRNAWKETLKQGRAAVGER